MLSQKSQSNSSLGWESVTFADAHTEKEKQAIYRFRYQVYVEEMGRSIPSIERRRKRITDGLDDWSILSYAELDGRVVGTLRMTIGDVSKYPQELIQVLQMDRFLKFAPNEKNLCLGTKIMVDPKFRNTPVSFRLMARGYDIMREHNVQFSFTGCNPFLIPMYEQLGYRRFTTGFQDPGYGFVVPVVLLPEDIEHLTAVHSPFLRLARKLVNSPVSRQWFLENIFDADKYPVALLTSEEERWEHVARIAGDPSAILPETWKLSMEEVKKIFRIGTPLHCLRETQFIRPRDYCNELYLLLAGEMKITNDSGSSRRAGPGEVVGSVGLFGETHHNVDVTAVSDCEILAISRVPFEKLLRTRPDLADKLNLVNPWEEEV